MSKASKTQADAEAAAFKAGTLPDSDRRAPEPIPDAHVVDGVVVDRVNEPRHTPGVTRESQADRSRTVPPTILPDADGVRAAAPDRSTESRPNAGPFQGRTADEIRRGVPADLRDHQQGVPLDTRTTADVAAGVPAPVDELERLLREVEEETGYAQKQAVADLRKVLGRPKRSQRDVQVLAAESFKVASADIHADHAAGRITQSERDRRVKALGLTSDTALLAQAVDREEHQTRLAQKQAAVPVKPVA